MTAYIIRRLMQAVVVLIIASIIVFILVRTLPGNPLLIFIAENQLTLLTEEDINALRTEFGLDKHIVVQYINWLGNLAHGDFGYSILQNEKVSTLIAETLPVTLHLGVLSIILSTILGISAGLISALRRGEWLDTIVTSLTNFGVSIPVFWLGILMMYLFSFYLGWLPVHGYTSPFDDFWLSTRKLIMPVICMSVVTTAFNARQTRSSMLEVLRQDYIRTAWSKGLTERIVVMRHAMKNGLIPVVTLIGIHVASIVGAAVIIETVFNIPGMGRLMVGAVFAQDYAIVQGGSLVISVLVILTNLAVDISYGWLDPRIRYG